MNDHTARNCSGGAEAHDAHMEMNNECPWDAKVTTPTNATPNQRKRGNTNMSKSTTTKTPAKATTKATKAPAKAAPKPAARTTQPVIPRIESIEDVLTKGQKLTVAQIEGMGIVLRQKAAHYELLAVRAAKRAGEEKLPKTPVSDWYRGNPDRAKDVAEKERVARREKGERAPRAKASPIADDTMMKEINALIDSGMTGWTTISKTLRLSGRGGTRAQRIPMVKAALKARGIESGRGRKSATMTKKSPTKGATKGATKSATPKPGAKRGAPASGKTKPAAKTTKTTSKAPARPPVNRRTVTPLPKTSKAAAKTVAAAKRVTTTRVRKAV